MFPNPSCFHGHSRFLHQHHFSWLLVLLRQNHQVLKRVTWPDAASRITVSTRSVLFLVGLWIKNFVSELLHIRVSWVWNSRSPELRLTAQVYLRRWNENLTVTLEEFAAENMLTVWTLLVLILIRIVGRSADLSDCVWLFRVHGLCWMLGELWYLSWSEHRCQRTSADDFTIFLFFFLSFCRSVSVRLWSSSLNHTDQTCMTRPDGRPTFPVGVEV